jgi:hypothetical protein
MLSKVIKAARIAATLGEARHRSFWLQRNVRNVPRRLDLAARTAARLPRFEGPLSAEAMARSSILQRDGYVMTPGVAPAAWVDDMRRWFETQPCSDPYRPELPAFVGPTNAPKGTHVAFFDHENVVAAPHALEIANNPVLLETVAANLGAKPTISYMTAWWSTPAGDGTAQHAENYHRDVDDFDFIKFFLYLTDVDEEAGPHVYVRGSHVANKLTTIRRYEDAEVHAAFGRDSEVRFTGQAGACFLEKTYGFHRGYPPKSKSRLIFQVLYSLRETIYGPKRPIIDAKGLGLDPFINRIYCRAP